MSPGSLTRKQFPPLALLIPAAVLVHGYHPAVEGAETYLLSIKKILNAKVTWQAQQCP